MYWHTLEKLDVSLEQFVKEALKYNSTKVKFNLSSSWKLQRSMSMLMDFGMNLEQVDNKREVNLYVYRHNKTDNFRRYAEIFAIAESGLIYGSIFAPDALYFDTPRSISNGVIYYGEHYLQFTNQKMAWENNIAMDWDERIDHQDITLDDFRKKYTPLPKFDVNRMYRQTNISIKELGNIIYIKHENGWPTKAVYLPLNELIGRYLEMDKLTRTVGLEVTAIKYPKNGERLHDDYFEFTAMHSYSTRKHDCWASYRGTISYDKFEVIECKMIDNGREYNWV